ncbi:MAG: SMP-30/gluconolactonase/LRE family protein [Ilumatobacteraceae bacterium]
MTVPESIAAQFEVLDDRFAGCRGDSRIERLYDGCRWAEGPVYVPAGRYVLWSDIPNDRMLRWDEMTGSVGVFREPAGHSNGNTLDREGRLITCEHGNRRVTRTEHDGSISVLATHVDGKRLNSPNDVIVRSDGSIWFTDPAYGIDSDYEGHRATSEIGACNVYRIDPSTGDVAVVADDFDRPNGLAFSLDESRLYIADTRRNHIRVFRVGDGTGPLGAGPLGAGEVFAECTAGHFDGFRLDDTGRLWAGVGDGVHCFDPDGTLIGKLHLPEDAANLTFGGLARNRLFITATTSLYSIRINVNGAARPTR